MFIVMCHINTNRQRSSSACVSGHSESLAHLRRCDILWSLLLLLLLWPASSSAQSFQQVILLTSKAGGTYKAFTDSFTENYTQNTDLDPSVEVKKLSITDPSISKSNWNSTNILFITVGSKAAELVTSMKLDAPVIHAMLPFSTYQNIYREHEDCSNHTAIYIDQPIRRQLDLSEEVFPHLNTYGIFLGAVSEKRYLIEKKLYSLPIETIRTVFVKESKSLAWSLRSLSENADMFIALNDPLVFNPNNAKWLLYMAYQERKPVIGFSQPYVSAGAAAAVYSTPSQLGKQTAEMVLKQQQKTTECLFKPQYPHYFKVSVNHAIIQSLSGKVLSENFLQKRLLQKEEKRK